LPAGAKAEDHSPEAVVQRIADRGARCVKVFIENGFGDATDWPLISDASLQRVRDAAHQRGLLLLAHANALDMQRIAVANDVDVIVHGLWNWDEFDAAPGVPEEIASHLRNLRAKKIGFQATMTVIAGLAVLFEPQTLDDPAYRKVVPPSLLAWYRTEEAQFFKKELRGGFDASTPDERIAETSWSVDERGMRAAKYLHDLGHPLLLGSDTPSAPTYGNQPGHNTFQEIQLMARAGIPLRAILAAGTIENARQFGVESDYGTVEAGKIANLLLLDANPLESAEAWGRIDKVILHGKIIERETLAADRE
jgi:imidazolonepropionase-like amidohydrolase